MVACVEQDPTTIIKMSNNEDANEDSIKAAVREATKKTQERMVAYQKKQAAKQEEAAKQLENKKPSKEALEAENTVSRLQAIVDESKRLTAKARETTSIAATASKQDAPKTPGAANGLTRNATTESVSKSARSSATPKAKKLSELFHSLNNSASSITYNPSSADSVGSLSRSATFDTSSLNLTKNTPGSKGKKLGAIFKSLNGSKSDLGEESVQKLFEDMSPDVLQQVRDRQKTNRRASTSQEIVDDESSDESFEVDIDEEEYDDSKKRKKKAEGAKKKKEASSDGEYSIFSLVGNKEETIATAGVKLRPDEAEDLIEDFYKPEQSNSDIPPLEDILETPKPEKPKPKIGSKTKKKAPADDEFESSMPLSMIDDMHNSMPCLAPFETPKQGKPKFGVPGNKIIGDNPSRDIPEESLNLSEIFRQPDMPAPGNPDSPTQVKRRASMDNANLPKAGRKSKEDRTTRTNSRGRGRKESEDDADSKAKRSKSKKGRSLRNSGHKRNEDVGTKAIKKYHSKGGEGSSTMEGLDVCEKTGEVKGMDLSAISSDDSDREQSMQDGSGGSHHSNQSTRSTRSTRSMSRSTRRGRPSGEGGRRGASRSVSRSSRRGGPRGASRSASVRRRRRSNGADDEHMRSSSRVSSRRNTVAGSRADDNNSSVRSERSMMHDASSRRERPLRATSRRNTVAGKEDDDNSSLRSERSLMNDASSRRERPLRHNSAASRRRVRSISRRGGNRRADQQRRSLDASERSTAEEILGALDMSDIKIVDSKEDDEEKKKKKPLDLGGKLSKLESTESPKPQDDDAGTVQSSATKKSRMGKFARKVGRTLVMKKKKKKDSAEGEEDDDAEEEVEGEEEDVDLAQLAADFDDEEQEIFENSGLQNSLISKGDVSQLQALGDLADEPEADTKKKRKSVFGRIKKIGQLGKKKKKKEKKGKGSERLDSDSESDDDEDQLLGSEYSQSESMEDEPEEPDEFVQLQIDGGGAAVINGSDVTDTPTKARQRRSSAVTMRRQRANLQRNNSLVAALDKRDEEQTAAVMRNRRARSLRGKSVRKGEMDESDTTDVKRTKSLKGRIEGESSSAKPLRKMRRSKSVEFPNNGETPSFDWEAFSAQKEAASKKGKGGKRRSMAEGGGTKERRMTGGLSALIYASQPVPS